MAGLAWPAGEAKKGRQVPPWDSGVRGARVCWLMVSSPAPGGKGKTPWGRRPGVEAVQGFSGLTSLGSHTGNLVTSLRPEVLTPAVGDPSKCQRAVPSPICLKLLDSWKW